MEIAFGILGQTTLRMHGQLTTEWGSLKLRRVLAALLTDPGARMGMATLAEWVWSLDEPEPNDPVSTFRTYSARIGKAMREAGVPAALRTADGALHLEVERSAIDYFTFEKLIETARRLSKEENHEAACEVATSALALWRGHPLADLTSQPAQTWRYAAVHNAWLPANQLLLGELIALGRCEAALQKLDELQREHRTDLGLARRRLHVLRELGRIDDMGAYHMSVRKLLVAEDDRAAAADLLAYYNSLLPNKISASAQRGARSAAERLASLPRPRPPSDSAVTLLPALSPRGRSTLPPAAAGFVGHHDLQKTLDGLARDADGRFRPGVIVLDGLAGIGKTALAVHWAHRQYGRLTDNALYLDLHGFDGGRPGKAEDVVDELLDAFDVPIARLPTPARRATKLRQILARQRTLVVLDNAASSAHVLPLLVTLSPSLLLVTSRQGLTALASRHGARRCSVTPLNELHAVEVLTNRVGPGGAAQQEPLARISALCGGVPLTLQLVAHHIESRRGAALTELADELRDQSRLLDIGDDGDDPPSNMRAALSVTYNALPREARDLLRSIGLSPAPELTLPAAAALAGRAAKEVRHALDVLVSTHFLTHTGAPGRYRVHDLLRTFARELAEAEDETEAREQAERRLLSYYLHAGFDADRLLFPFRPPVPMLPVLDGVPAAEFTSESAAAAWLLSEKNNFDRLIPWAAQRNHHEYAWRLAHPLYGIYRRYGFYSELRDAYSVSVNSTQTVDNLEAEGATRSDLGLICLALGERDAALRELHLAAAIAQQTGGAVWIATSLLHLGTFEAHIGNADDAEAMYRRALGKLRATSNPGIESAILHRLAETLRERDRLDEALTLYRRALALKQGISNRHGEAEILAELAATLCRLGNYEEARRHGLHALTIIEQINDVEAGPRACLVMAEVNHRQARHAATIAYARQAVRLAMRNHNAIVEAEALHILGHALHETGRLAAAEEGWLAATAIYLDLGNRERELHLRTDLAVLREGPAETDKYSPVM